ncbi:MAG: c-type cytochrome [Deltaproteobacteria bacterium]|nr:c-type cytochrome [Deltaproteobacteria bacterium]
MPSSRDLAPAATLLLALVASAAAACVSSPKPSQDAGVAASASASTSPDAGREGATASADATIDSPAVASVERGQKLYAKYCNFCHGAEGKGYAADEAPALANDDLLSIATDEFLHDAIANGRPGTTMSSWFIVRGGPLSDDDVLAIVAYLRTWQKRPSESTAGRTLSPNASAERGAAIYAAHCASCHGAKGWRGKHNALANPELLISATDGFLATTIERGRAGTPMQGFGEKLGKEKIDDVVAFLRTWQKEPDVTPTLPPKAGALVSVVLNPKGPEPSFDPKADFVPVDDVKKEHDRKASMVIIDARPPADYARMHIVGAISVPFYDVEAFAKQIPKDKYVLTYCACPHAESMKVQLALRNLGYKRVAVINEGLFAWRDRGYPVHGGPKP